MIFGFLCLVIAVLIAAACAIYADDGETFFFVGAIGVAIVMAVWGVVAWPVSTYNRNSCETLTEGYGLERSDWSFRNGCRVELPSGQLVPEGRIRITSDGEIVVADES